MPEINNQTDASPQLIALLKTPIYKGEMGPEQPEPAPVPQVAILTITKKNSKISHK